MVSVCNTPPVYYEVHTFNPLPIVSSAPEILLGATTYSTAIDMWSVGCIFAELLLNEPLFQAKGEIEMISMIFKLLGPPTSQAWPDYHKMPLAKTITLPSPHPSQLRQKFPHITAAGLDLLSQLLAYDPEMRTSAEDALKHPYFTYAFDYLCHLVTSVQGHELIPLPPENHLFRSIPTSLGLSHLLLLAKSTCTQRSYNALLIVWVRRRKPDSPSAPARVAEYKLLTEFD